MKIRLLLLFISQLALIISPSAPGARNPFLPARAPCAQAGNGWRYQGIILRQNQPQRALLRHRDDRWLRVSAGDTLPDGSTVLHITFTSISLSAGTDCPPVTLPASYKEPPPHAQTTHTAPVNLPATDSVNTDITNPVSRSAAPATAPRQRQREASDSAGKTRER